jgi:hypothetical protein
MNNDAPGHVSLVELIKASYLLFDVGAVGLLRLVGEQMAKDKNCCDVLEQTVSEVGDGMFVQEKCPFSSTIAAYNESCHGLPQELTVLADHANQQRAAWVSAFCGIHQTYRRARFGNSYHHIACRFGSDVSIADQDYLSNKEVEDLLEKNICVFIQKP